MANIATEVKEELFSYEISELERILEAVESYEMYSTGLNKINGGYANAEAEYINDDKNGEIIWIKIESGEREFGNSNIYKSNCFIPRNILGDKKLTLKDKLEQIHNEN